MSLDRFKNKSEVLGFTPVFGETIKDSDKNLIAKLNDVPLKSGDLKGNFGGGNGEVQPVIEKHIYADESLLSSFYDQTLLYKENPNTILVKPELDLRIAGLRQGVYSVCYNFLHKYVGNPAGYSDIRVTEISSNRKELKIGVNRTPPPKTSKVTGQVLGSSINMSSADEISPSLLSVDNTINNTPSQPSPSAASPGLFGLLYDIYNSDGFNAFNSPNTKKDFVLNFGENRLYDIVNIRFNGPRVGRSVEEISYPTGVYQGVGTVLLPLSPNALKIGEWTEWIEVYNPGIGQDTSLVGQLTTRTRYFQLQETSDGKLKLSGATDWNNPLQPPIYRVPVGTTTNLNTVTYREGLGELGTAFVNEFDENKRVNLVNQNLAITYDYYDDTLTSYDEIIVKLYDELGDEIGINAPTSIYGRISNSFVEKVIAFPAIPKKNYTNFSQPNFNVEFDVVRGGNGTEFQTWDSLLDTNSQTSQQIITHYFSSSLGNLKLNIDYSDFSNYIHFSSATERVDNFVYKVQQIETYNNRINALQSISGSEALTNISQSIVRRDRVVGGFDDFEKWLYYDVNARNYTHWSSSAYTIEPYPKSATFPHILHPFTSSQAETWYSGVYASASLYDSQNQATLNKMIPIHLRDDEKNSEYITFVDMIGQHFDIQWTYVNALTSINQREEHPEDGMSSELLNDVAKTFGWKLSNGYSDSNLWNYVLGTDSSGSLAQTGLMQSKSRDFITKEVWRRIVNHIPYLYKTKGTARSIKALLAAYGIPQAFLQIREWGGPAISTRKNVFEHDRFVYKLQASPSRYIETPWDDINLDRPSTIEVIGKMPKANYHIFRLTSGSDYVDYFWDYNTTYETARVRSAINGTTFMSSSYFSYKFRRDGVFVMTSGSGNSLQMGMVDDFGEIFATRLITGSENGIYNNVWSTNTGTLQVPGPTTSTNINDYKTASIQEIRYYRDIMSNEIVQEHAKNREAYFIDDNTTDLNLETAYDKLPFRIFPDSSFSVTSSFISSIHPNQKIRVTDSGLTLSASITNMAQGDLVGEVDTMWQTIPSVGALNLMNNKIRVESASLSGILNPNKNVEVSEYDYAPNDSNLLGTYFSTTDTVNNDIYNSEGYFEADDWVGDPDKRYNEDYPLLKFKLKNYFQKYTGRTAVNLILSMLSRYDMSIFEQIRQVLPARVDWHRGILIEPSALERNKFRRPSNIRYTKHFWDGSINMSNVVLTATKHDYGFTSGSYHKDYLSDGVIDLYNFAPSTYKYIIPMLSSSGDYFNTTNGYWDYSPTGSVVTLARPSQNGGQTTALFFSSDLSASMNLPSSASYIPSRGSDYQGLSLENLKFNGCRISSDSITTDSPDTPDGGPVIEVTTVDSNKLVFSTKDTPGGGDLTVGIDIPGGGKKPKVMDLPSLISVDVRDKKKRKSPSNIDLESRLLREPSIIVHKPSGPKVSAALQPRSATIIPPNMLFKGNVFFGDSTFYDSLPSGTYNWNSLVVIPNSTYILNINGNDVSSGLLSYNTNTITISSLYNPLGSGMSNPTPMILRTIFLVKRSNGQIVYTSPDIYNISYQFTFGKGTEDLDVRIITAT